ncbi:MAG: NAD(P)/FAD-dependent oxidoreductase [Bacteroidota bacterium]
MDTSNTLSIPKTEKERIVIVGAGFGGLEIAKCLKNSAYQVILIDKNNFHQFQPLFYQVAMAALEPSSIIFPLRRVFREKQDVHVRIATVESVDPTQQILHTSFGYLPYDHLVLAMGATSNFFGNKKMEQLGIPMKSVSEAINVRNTLLEDFEHALAVGTYEGRQPWLDIVIVGGGATGVELAGSLAEMKKTVFRKDYPELDTSEMDIYLVEGGDRLLSGMTEFSSKHTLAYLKGLGVRVKLNTLVKDYDGETVFLSDESTLQSHKLIWAAGIKGSIIPGIPKENIVRGDRIKVDTVNKVAGCKNMYAIGDIAYMETEHYPKGHPQVAQPAIQQGRHLAQNFKRRAKGQSFTGFVYRDKGSMATVGRRKAVVELGKLKIKGWIASSMWLVVHLFSLYGIRNRFVVLMNWLTIYFTYDHYLRLNIRPFIKSRNSEVEVDS